MGMQFSVCPMPVCYVTAMHTVMASLAKDMTFEQKILWVPVEVAFIDPVIFELYLGQLVYVHRYNRRDTPRNGFHIRVRLSYLLAFIVHNGGGFADAQNADIFRV